MTAYLWDWLNLLGRGVHVITGIAWIGASFYFIWLDNHLEKTGNPALAGDLWAVHGGGFYHAQKYAAAPPAIPARLHWFKWEAYSTLLSGLFLLGIVYYANPEAYLIDPSIAQLSPLLAVVVGISWIAGGWLVYDAVCRSGIDDRTLAIVLAILCAGAAWGLCNVFPGRAAFLHFGAMLGTIMVLNVFFVIIPGQKALVEAAKTGRAVDPSWGARGKQRSVHNTYFTLPVVFTMISNHYAWVFGAPWNWAWLIAISAAGALIRTWFVARHKGAAATWPLAAAAILLLATAYGVRPRPASVSAAPAPAPSAAALEAARVEAIAAERCAPCHAASPRRPGFSVAPNGVKLENEAQLRAQAAKVRAQVSSRAMPPGNLTGMTDAERATLVEWLDTVAKANGRP